MQIAENTIADEKSDSPNRYWYFIEKLNGANIEQD